MPIFFWIPVLIILGLQAAMRPAFGHSWYPYECCSDKDCSQVPAAAVKRGPAGYMTPKGHLIPHGDKRIRPLPAGVVGVHLCERIDGTPICLFIGEDQF